MKKGVYVWLVILLWCLTFVLAFDETNFIINNDTIGNVYNLGSFLSGLINVSATDVSANATFESNLGGSIRMLDFLIANNIDLSCLDYNCTESYTTGTTGLSTKGVSIPQDELVGFIIKGKDDVKITSLSFDISSNFPSSNSIPLKINFFNDYNWSWEESSQDYNPSNVRFGSMGCYSDLAATTEFVEVGSVPYCESITNLPSAKEYLVGANLVGSGVSDMFMTFESENSFWNGDASCEFDASVNKSCIIELDEPLPAGDYLICINSADGPSGYTLAAESFGQNCGYYNARVSGYDYPLFVNVSKYASSATLEISDTQFEDHILTSINNYLGERYPSSEYGNTKGDCNTGCVFPLKFTGVNQTLTISNVSLKYESNAGLPTETKIYDVFFEPVLLSFKETLDLSFAKFPLNITGNKTLKLTVNGVETYNSLISILPAPQILAINPMNPLAGVNTEFTLKVESENNISKYEWIFGDGKVETTNTNKVSHTYTNKTTYNLTVHVTDSKGVKSTKEFVIFAGSPREIVNKTLLEKKEAIDSFTKQLNNLTSWQKDYVKERLNLQEIVNSVNYLDEQRKGVISDEEFIGLALQLSDLVVPVDLLEVKTSQEPFLVNVDDIDVTPLNELSSERGIGEDADYQISISEWERLNIEGLITYKRYEILGDDGDQVFLMYSYSLDLKSKSENDSFIIVDKNSAKSSMVLNSVGSFVSMDLPAGANKKYEFVYGIDEIAKIYVAPDIASLNYIRPIDPCNFDGVCQKELGEDYKNCRSDCKPIVFPTLWLILLLVCGFMLYTLLQVWYTYNYESKLFEDRSHLFNLVNYIDNMSQRNALENEVRSSLSKQGWSQEKINYAIKKAKGRNTGMYELLPVQKIIAANKRAKAKKEVRKNPDVQPVPPRMPGMPPMMRPISQNLPPRLPPRGPLIRRPQNTNLNKPKSFRNYRRRY